MAKRHSYNPHRKRKMTEEELQEYLKRKTQSNVHTDKSKEFRKQKKPPRFYRDE